VGRLAVILAALCGAAVCAGAGEARQTALDAQVTSAALGGRMPALVILPSGYATSHRRYPVVYFLHGLPVGSSAYKGNAWLTPLAAAAGSFILVEPQGARDDDRDPEYLDWGSGRDWSTYVTRELTRYVDAHSARSSRDRDARSWVSPRAGTARRCSA
jgi:S-formylglutathione hydrolase FrmB